MDNLWSPWRAVHVSTSSDNDPGERASLFERIGAAVEKDEENLVVWRGKTVFVVMNRFPYTSGHVMILPLRRVATFHELTPEERGEVSETIARCMRWLDEALRPEGYNVGLNQGAAAGAGFPDHLHLHVVPRWSGDTNFMPTTAQVSVIPEDLHETYRRIREAARRNG